MSKTPGGDSEAQCFPVGHAGRTRRDTRRYRMRLGHRRRTDLTRVRIEGRVHADLLSGAEDVLLSLVLIPLVLVALPHWQPGEELVRRRAKVVIRAGREWAIIPHRRSDAGGVPIVPVRQPLRPFDLPGPHIQCHDRVHMVVGRKAELLRLNRRDAVLVGRSRRVAEVVAGADEDGLPSGVDDRVAQRRITTRSLRTSK
jgi:hypothetical protein